MLKVVIHLGIISDIQVSGDTRNRPKMYCGRQCRLMLRPYGSFVCRSSGNTL